jgi:antitoxin component YwqK of YwqJK toxin-antitoxin module
LGEPKLFRFLYVKFVLLNCEFNFNDMKKTLILSLIITAAALCSAQSNPVAVDGKYFNASGEPFTGTTSIEVIEADAVTVQEIEVVDGLLHGSVRYFNQNGTLTEVGSYSQGLKNGRWLQYASSGLLIGEAYYKNGLKDGIWTVWDEAGVKRYHMVYSQGKKVDTWKMWDEHANLVSERVYKD